jgi:hypothetical protein
MSRARRPAGYDFCSIVASAAKSFRPALDQASSTPSELGLSIKGDVLGG